MGCNCNKDALIKHVKGNVLRLAIPLTIKIRDLVDGQPTEREKDFYPDASRGVKIVLDASYITRTFDGAVSGNVVSMEDDGTLKLGYYQVEVLCYDNNGIPYRYMARNIIAIVDATADAGIEADIEFDSETYTLEGAYFIKGDKGDTGEGVPSGGTTGQVLKKKSNDDYDTEWSSDNAPVTSVNGKTGDVTLGAEEVGALPADTPLFDGDYNSLSNKPDVYTKSEVDDKFMVETFDANGHEYVDLGLPSGTLWATKNIGAKDSVSNGQLFAWGDTEGWDIDDVIENGKTFDWNNYKFTPNGEQWDTNFGITKYNVSDGKTTLELEDDAARANMGGDWQMPTEAQWQELFNTQYVNVEQQTIEGVLMIVITSKTDSSKKVYFIKESKHAERGAVMSSEDLVWSNALAGTGYSTKSAKSCRIYTLIDKTRAFGYQVRGVITSGSKTEKYATKTELENKEDVTTIVAPVNATDATAPITSLTTEVGKYYRIDVPVETLAVTLPAMTDTTVGMAVVLFLTGGTTPNVTIVSTAPSGGTAPAVHFADGFEIKAAETNEVNCYWNGLAWIVASVKIVISNS